MYLTGKSRIYYQNLLRWMTSKVMVLERHSCCWEAACIFNGGLVCWALCTEPWAGLERAPEVHSSAENSLCIALQYQNNEITSLELRIEE